MGEENNKSSKIEIRQCNRDDGIFTEILIDGHKLHGVRRFELKQEVGNEIPILTVDLNAMNLSTDLMFLKVAQAGMGEIESIKFKGDEIPIRFSKE